MAERSILYSDLWTIYKAGNENRQIEILHWFNLPKHLPLYTWEMQVQVLTGAPPEILKQHSKLIDPRAKKKLGLEDERKEVSNKKVWSLFMK